MKPPTLPAAPWQASPLPDSHAIVTGDGYFLLNLEGLPTTPEAAAALRRAVAALPDLLEAMHRTVERWTEDPDDLETMDKGIAELQAALRKAGYTATVPQTTETPAP